MIIAHIERFGKPPGPRHDSFTYWLSATASLATIAQALSAAPRATTASFDGALLAVPWMIIVLAVAGIAFLLWRAGR
jgi:amino acid transporter